MKQIKYTILKLTCVCMLACMVTGCEGNSSSSSEKTNSQALTGKWSGISATGQVPSTLRLTEANNQIGGSLKWPGDTRSVRGTHNGSVVLLYIGGGDVWNLTFSSGKTLRGFGTKPNGNSYSVDFSRASD